MGGRVGRGVGEQRADWAFDRIQKGRHELGEKALKPGLRMQNQKQRDPARAASEL
jgi:hypothetical protein